MKYAPLNTVFREAALSPEYVAHLQAASWRYGFIALLRRIGADPRIDPIGTARRPQAEPFRLGQAPSLAFAPREIADVKQANARLKIRLLGLGMLGPNGPLPIHVTEIAREREQHRHDATLVDFLDIFHHRYLTLLYRAWAEAQAAAGLDRPGDEQFSFTSRASRVTTPARLDTRRFRHMRASPLPRIGCVRPVIRTGCAQRSSTTSACRS